MRALIERLAGSRGYWVVVASMLVGATAIGFAFAYFGGLPAEPAALASGEAEADPAPSAASPMPEPTATVDDRGDSLSTPEGPFFTAVIASLSEDAGGESEALKRMRGANRRGVKARVLLSSHYSSLRPGFWVVYVGNFDSASEAGRKAAQLQVHGFGGAYARCIGAATQC